MTAQQPKPDAAVQSRGGDDSWQAPAICLGLALITLAVFGRTVGFGFVEYDDNAFVYQNPIVAGGLSLKGIAWVFTHADCFLYHPVTMLSLMANAQFFGLRPWSYHLTNVLLHTASAILLFLILRQMTGALWRCAFVAAVFAVHPLRVESVAWVAERKDVLGAFFFILTMGAYARYVRKPDSRGGWAAVVAAFVMALLSKPSVVTLPFVLLLLDYWPLKRTEALGKLVLEKLPLFILAAVACLVTIAVARKFVFPGINVPVHERLANALFCYVTYLRQIIWPAGLAVPYPYPHIALLSGQTALAGLLLAALSFGVWRERLAQPWLLVGWLWYLGVLMPMIGIVPAGDFAQADRYTYLPHIGIYLAATWLLADLAAALQVSRAALGGLMAAAVIALMLAAGKQATYWQNSETLWTRALSVTTDNTVARANLGSYLLRSGRMDDVKTLYQRGLGAGPENSESHNNLGIALLQKGQLNEAVAHFKRALELNPGNAQAHLNYGSALLREEKFADAGVEFESALQLKPGDLQIQNNYAWLLATCAQSSLRNGARALDLARQANQATGGTNPVVLRTLAAAFAEAGKFPDAIAAAQRALGLPATRANPRLGMKLQAELKLYQAGKPFHLAEKAQ